jgi:hypothetical protein
MQPRQLTATTAKLDFEYEPLDFLHRADIRALRVASPNYVTSISIKIFDDPHE